MPPDDKKHTELLIQLIQILEQFADDAARERALRALVTYFDVEI